MLAFLKVLRQLYGGAEGYLTKAAGFSDEDVKKIKANLLGSGTLSLL